MTELFKHLNDGDSPSAREYNRLLDAVSGLLKSSGVQYLSDSRGVHVRRMPVPAGERILMTHIGGEVIPHNVLTLIPVATVISDPNGWYDSTNFGFIAPVKGVYFTSSSFFVTYATYTDISAAVYARNAGSGEAVRSTTNYTPSVGFGGAGVYWSTVGMIEMDAGDLLQFFFLHQAGAGNIMTVTSGGHAGMFLLR